MAQIWLLLPIFVTATGWLYLLTLFAPSGEGEMIKEKLSFPSNLEELQLLAADLKAYSRTHWHFLFLIFCSAYIYKQTFCIPGSLFLNMLSGALYGRIGGLFLACLLTAIGASCCYSLSKDFAKEHVASLFPSQLKSFEEKVRKNRESIFYFMLFLRLVPVTPGWVVNLVSPIVNIPFLVFFVTALIGLVPYNFVGVSAGSMLSTVTSVNDVFTWSTFFNFVLIALAALLPTILMKPKNSTHL